MNKISKKYSVFLLRTQFTRDNGDKMHAYKTESISNIE